jgi:NADPH-dependent ferric siderophore reductase
MTRRAGLFESALQKLFTRSARVLEIEPVGSSFLLIALGGDALRNVDWTPGDKLQLMLGGWLQRTYTPIEWDGANGRTRILVYLHGDAPGTQWARALRLGDSCVLLGPRKSVRLAPAASPVILFGDETSLGLAAALSRQATLHMLCEVSARADALAVIAHLELEDVQLESAGQGAAAMPALLQAHPDADVVLSGQAGAIQQVSHLLREQGIVSARRQSKAYWAPGKTGLD